MITRTQATDPEFGTSLTYANAGEADNGRVNIDASNNVINGSGGNDLLDCGAGAERIGQGTDTVEASMTCRVGAGAESLTLTGSLGSDTLIGGKGADKSVCDSLPNAVSNVDQVQDFSKSQSDTFLLSKAAFAALASRGEVTQGVFLASATAVSGQDADGQTIYNSVTGISNTSPTVRAQARRYRLPRSARRANRPLPPPTSRSSPDPRIPHLQAII